jgi:predicted metal-binding protein
LLRKDTSGEVYRKVIHYINQNWKEGFTDFLYTQIPVTKRPQRLLNIAFNFYSTKEGYTYWKKIAQEWKSFVMANRSIKDVIKIRRR